MPSDDRNLMKMEPIQWLPPVDLEAEVMRLQQLIDKGYKKHYAEDYPVGTALSVYRRSSPYQGDPFATCIETNDGPRWRMESNPPIDQPTLARWIGPGSYLVTPPRDGAPDGKND